MIYFHEKGIELIKQASNGATEGLICTPYYSERGLQLLDPFFDTAEKVEFWTRFSPLDWKAGVADMAALNKRIQSVLDKKKEFIIRVSDDLHAKIYNFSNNTVIIGSANLTWSAMTNNIEIICQLTEEDADSFSSVLSSMRGRLMPMGAEVFAAYVDVVADAISKPFDGPVEEDEEMNAAIDIAEEALRESLSGTVPEVIGIPLAELQEFIYYCRQENSGVSREIIARHERKQNLQGHVKHCFYGSVQFLSEHKEFVSEIAATPEDLLYDLVNSSVCTYWRDFLREHANEIDKDRGFWFRTLRIYLPLNLGGTLTGGAGASSTLKRVLPVVARMIRG